MVLFTCICCPHILGEHTPTTTSTVSSFCPCVRTFAWFLCRGWGGGSIDNKHICFWTEVVSFFIFRRFCIHGQSALLREIHWTHDWFGGKEQPPISSHYSASNPSTKSSCAVSGWQIFRHLTSLPVDWNWKTIKATVKDKTFNIYLFCCIFDHIHVKTFLVRHSFPLWTFSKRLYLLNRCILYPDVSCVP